MQEKLKKHITQIDKLLKENNLKNKEELLEDHLTQIKFYQHERLVHLIVTFFVGTISILFLLTGLILEQAMLFLLFLLTFILFVPYIFHYYYLENGVQKLYEQYWNLKNK